MTEADRRRAAARVFRYKGPTSTGADRDMADRLSNADARRVFLRLHELSGRPAGPARRRDLPALAESLGFVQIDSIRTVERAHHHILASRAPGYRPGWLAHHLERERSLFENWTHDASVVPARFFPYWKPRFRRTGAALMRLAWFRERLGDDPEGTCRRVLDFVAENGPAMARDLKSANPPPPEGLERAPGAWWGWHPSKAALVFLWRTGKLAVAAREGFQKSYDLTERVIPAEHLDGEPTEAGFLHWHCAGALERLGFASPTEIARYWEAVGPAEAAAWSDGPGRAAVREIEVEGGDGTFRPALARPDLFELARAAPEPPARVRFLSPFDPLARDRNRLARLFGFDFRIEIYVPRARRAYGYYVYPMLERDRLVGRVEMRADRDAGVLAVEGLWPEPGVRLGKARRARIEAELDRWRRYAGLDGVRWAPSAGGGSAGG